MNKIFNELLVATYIAIKSKDVINLQSQLQLYLEDETKSLRDF